MSKQLCFLNTYMTWVCRSSTLVNASSLRDLSCVSCLRTPSMSLRIFSCCICCMRMTLSCSSDKIRRRVSLSFSSTSCDCKNETHTVKMFYIYTRDKVCVYNNQTIYVRIKYKVTRLTPPNLLLNYIIIRIMLITTGFFFGHTWTSFRQTYITWLY